MLDQLIHIDQQLLLALNGSDSLYWDVVMMAITKTAPWIPLAVLLLYVVIRNNDFRRILLFVGVLALVILIADRFSSGWCKPFFHRFRPTHEPALQGLIDMVDDYHGGLYGFISSHAANTFAVASFVSLFFKNWRMTLTLFCWAVLSCSSRIYLGVHYPGDILAGALFGVLDGWLCYLLYRFVCSKWTRGEVSMPDKTSQHDVWLVPTGFLLTCVVILLYGCFVLYL